MELQHVTFSHPSELNDTVKTSKIHFHNQLPRHYSCSRILCILKHSSRKIRWQAKLLNYLLIHSSYFVFSVSQSQSRVGPSSSSTSRCWSVLGSLSDECWTRAEKRRKCWILNLLEKIKLSPLTLFITLSFSSFQSFCNFYVCMAELDCGLLKDGNLRM